MILGYFDVDHGLPAILMLGPIPMYPHIWQAMDWRQRVTSSNLVRSQASGLLKHRPVLCWTRGSLKVIKLKNNMYSLCTVYIYIYIYMINWRNSYRLVLFGLSLPLWFYAFSDETDAPCNLEWICQNLRSNCGSAYVSKSIKWHGILASWKAASCWKHPNFHFSCKRSWKPNWLYSVAKMSSKTQNVFVFSKCGPIVSFSYYRSIVYHKFFSYSIP